MADYPSPVVRDMGTDTKTPRNQGVVYETSFWGFKCQSPSLSLPGRGLFSSPSLFAILRNSCYTLAVKHRAVSSIDAGSIALLPLIILTCCIASYLIGSLPFGLWIGLIWKGVDIRTLGSKNIGATNVLRVLGPAPAATVFVLDTLKGAFVLVLAVDLLQANIPFPFHVLIGLCAIIGHTFSPFLQFKGGKGVATSLGVLLALSPLVAVIALVSWLVILGITRYVSLASLVAAYTLPFSALQVHATLAEAHSPERWWMFWLGIVLAVLVTVKHRANIQRLLAGTEPKIGQRVEAPSESAEVH